MHRHPGGEETCWFRRVQVYTNVSMTFPAAEDDSGISVSSAAIPRETSASSDTTTDRLLSASKRHRKHGEWDYNHALDSPPSSASSRFRDRRDAAGLHRLIDQQHHRPSIPPAGHLELHQLFQKELTPSDVGKLNRLVIPKKHAVRHLPAVLGVGGGEVEGTMVEFRDREGRRWEFRYCYWRSSQSFVFTKGWNRFVRTKALRPGDTVVFYRCEHRRGGVRPFELIDVQHAGVDGAGEAAAVERKGVWLFGVQIGG